MTESYTRTAIALHWIMALLILAALALGLVMTDMPLSPRKLAFYAWHKWLGVTVFGLGLVRLIWRNRHPPPPLPATVPGWQRTAAHVSHWLLYVLMSAIPLVGWLMSSAKGFQTVYLGVLPIPDLLDKNEAWGGRLDDAHAWLARALILLLVLHVAAAVKHHFIDGDDVLRRMLPGMRHGKERE